MRLSRRSAGNVRGHMRRLSVSVLCLGFSLARTAFAEQTSPPQLQGQLAGAGGVMARQFRFEGNTAFTDTELAAAVDSFRNRVLHAEDLEEARRKLTLYYVQAGYINSGAVLRDQTVRDGVITFTIIEGTLDRIQVDGQRRFRPDYLAQQIRRSAGPPLHLPTMQNALQNLRQSPNIERINSELKPGLRPGQAWLDVHVVEAPSRHAAVQFNNYRPSSIGAERFEIIGADTNFSGRDDTFSVRYGATRNGFKDPEFAGDDDYSLSYTSPVDSAGARLTVDFTKTDADVIEEPFGPLGITSTAESLSVRLRKPLVRTLHREVAMSLAVEHRRSSTYLAGIPFSFSPGSVRGESVVTVLRWGQEWLRRSQQSVLALRSTFSLGLDAMGATDNGTSRDGKFLTWLGQGQYVRRLGESDRRLFLRFSGQWSSDPLLSLEQFSVGGARTVRGFRENQLVRDMGAVLSAELRLPVMSRESRTVLELAPFIDLGFGKDRGTSSVAIGSLGLGLLARPTPRLHLEVYWGHPFRELGASSGDLQDHGLHFNLTYTLFDG